jgi:hypothetical protein
MVECAWSGRTIISSVPSGRRIKLSKCTVCMGDHPRGCRESVHCRGHCIYMIFSSYGVPNFSTESVSVLPATATTATPAPMDWHVRCTGYRIYLYRVCQYGMYHTRRPDHTTFPTLTSAGLCLSVRYIRPPYEYHAEYLGTWTSSIGPARCSEAIHVLQLLQTSFPSNPFLTLHNSPSSIPILPSSPYFPPPSSLRRLSSLSAIARDLGYLRRPQLPRAPPTCREQRAAPVELEARNLSFQWIRAKFRHRDFEFISHSQ